ncbi:MAG TPA: 1-deoxy-D-xylulose-5-phosphate reductoisomerase, partial [Paludibacteraceae bacterium]|nr:1-deoxy-D-xylulose-5-phosphate reductoisomerase [Paludibacteraceae bacterium]
MSNTTKQIAVLGSTGSIGKQALQVITDYPDRFSVYALTANNNIDLLIKQARKFQPEIAIIANENHFLQLKEALSDLPIKVFAGEESIAQ